MSVIYRPGYWTDVCVLPDGRFAQVTTDGAMVRCFAGDALAWEVRASEALMFCRAAVNDGRVLSIHQGHDSGNAWLIGDAMLPKDLGLTFGVQPVAIDSTYAYVVRSNQSYDRIRLDNGAVEHLPHGAPGSSQGISDVRAGAVQWADAFRTVQAHGVTLTYPNGRGGVIVGQADPPQIAGIDTVHGLFTAIPGAAFEPHVAQSGDRYAIVARTPQGAAYVEVPPYPALLTAAAPVPVPVPQPVPAPEPKPVSIAFPVSAKVVRDRYVMAFPVPQKSTPGNADDAFENLCRAWVLALAEQVRFQTNDSRWGVKNAGGGRPQSKDSLTWNGERLVNFDLLSGVGTGKPTLVKDPAGVDITGQTFLPVQPVDHLGPAMPDKPTPQPAPQPIPQPGPAVDLASLQNELAALAARNALLEARMLALETKPAPTYKVAGTTSRDFGHSHRINVTLEQA